ncbi:unnamed protein product, partial [Symbiodinium sp. KB8]
MAAASEGTPVPGAAGSQGEGPGLPGRQRADTAMSGAADGAPVAKGRSKRWGMEVSVACWVVQCLCSLHSACLPLVQDYVANPQAKLQDLPAHFHDADFDPVRWVLVSSPEGQQRQPAGHTETMPLDLGEFAQFAMEQQTSKDEARDAVLSQLSRAVLGNYTAFIDGMRQIHEVDMDVSRAMVHVSNALRQLRGGKAALATHSLRITAQQRHLVRAKGVLTRLRWMRSVLQAGSNMKAAVAQGHFQEAVRVAATAAAHLEEATASKFVALEHARSQAAAALPGVRDAMDAALGTLVQQWVMLDPTPATTQVLPRVAHWLDSLAAGATGSSLLLGQREASPASAAASNSGGSEGAEASAAPGGFWESLPPLLRLPESFPSLLNAYMQLDEAGVDVRVPAVHSAAPAGGLALGGGEGDAGGDEADALLGE